MDWLGRVPEHWEQIPLKRLVRSIGQGWSPECESWPANGDEWGVLKVGCVNGGSFRPEENKALPATLDPRPDLAVRKGDVLVSRANTRELVGSCVAAPQDYPNLLLCDKIYRIRIGERVTPEFLAALITVHGRRSIEIEATGASSSMLNISQSVILNLPVALPAPAEQDQIMVASSRETSRIDALIKKKTRFIELLREKRQALITHAVTKGLDPNAKLKDSGVEWLGEVPEQWVVRRFRDICISISTGPFGTALGNEDYVTGGVPVINPSHIVDEQCCPDPDITVSAETAKRLSFWAMRTGDLVTARRGELGRSAVISEAQDGWICGTGSLRVRAIPTQALSGYLHTVLQSRYAREWLNLASVGATMANLNEGILGNLPLVVPPSIAEQEKLLASLEILNVRINKIEQKASASVALLQERRSALITAAVTGQIDLREAV
ncbi:restriction endonuclease subunit S [Pseudomonas sp. BF61]|uniref:restriction endonuclease subunit S n=1 Tax=Pseudomonas sp. BF61 TaxID=2741068 RepID=UPI001C0DDDBD|nr:restriction endonuclease subunit S [Pseudomonas sp. BF61]MBU4628424.1 restriction endonuclease subunit S [Pseudomonas sp. BF61]